MKTLGASQRCSVAVEEMGRFQKLWEGEGDFSHIPGPKQIDSWLRKELLKKGSLTSDARTLLKAGANPLTLDPGMAYALRSVYLKLIETSSLNADKRSSLRSALEAAITALLKETPMLAQGGGSSLPPPGDEGLGNNGGGSDGDGGGEGAAPGGEEYARKLERHLWRARMQKCAVRSGILLVVSELITTAGAIEAKWKFYAGGEGKGIDKILDSTTWQRAVGDKDFVHNLTWNAVLMMSLGGFSCLSNKEAGKNLVAAVAAVSSVVGQYMQTGKVSVRQLVIDTLFVRLISVNKSALVFRLAENYQKTGYPAPVVVEAFMQAISEGIGAYAYPRANEWSKRIWKE